MIKQERMQVIKQQEIAKHIFELTVQGGLADEMSEPGQFVHIRVADSFEPLLRRPISVASIDLEASQFTMIYRAEGRGNRAAFRKEARRHAGCSWAARPRLSG